MPGPAPKPAATRQRKNKTSTAATLPSIAEAAAFEVPQLHKRDWHANVTAWWESVWTSPMAAEYLQADKLGGLYLLADLHQIRWTATESSDLIDVAKEIRLQEVRFGLSPIDRRRLQWEIDDDAAPAVGQVASPARKPANPGKDPRGVLQVMP